MATKAQHFKAEVDRAKHAGRAPSAVRKGKKKPTAAARPAAPKPRGRRRNSLYELEPAAARPSRKSTRKSNNRIKTDGVLRINQIGRASSSKTRAGQRRA
jgi:hypothetical protein